MANRIIMGCHRIPPPLRTPSAVFPEELCKAVIVCTLYDVAHLLVAVVRED